MLNERRRRPNRRRPVEKLETSLGVIKTRGRTGKEHSVDTMPRLVNRDGSPQTTARDILSRHTAGPKGKLPGKKESTVYHDIGYLMAEALGLISEEEYDSEKELRRELDAEARRTGKNSGDDVILKGSVTEPKKKKKKVIIRKKKATRKKKSKLPTDRQIAQRWRGPDASPLGG